MWVQAPRARCRDGLRKVLPLQLLVKKAISWSAHGMTDAFPTFLSMARMLCEAGADPRASLPAGTPGHGTPLAMAEEAAMHVHQQTQLVGGDFIAVSVTLQPLVQLLRCLCAEGDLGCACVYDPWVIR